MYLMQSSLGNILVLQQCLFMSAETSPLNHNLQDVPVFCK